MNELQNNRNRVARSNKFKKFQICPKSIFKKAKSSKLKTSQIKVKFLMKSSQTTWIIFWIFTKFALIFPKHALKGIFSSTLKKVINGQMATLKWKQELRWGAEYPTHLPRFRGQVLLKAKLKLNGTSIKNSRNFELQTYCLKVFKNIENVNLLFLQFYWLGAPFISRKLLTSR